MTNKLNLRAALLMALAIAALSAQRAAALSEQAETCTACHDASADSPAGRISSFDSSVHKDLDCTACHAGAEQAPHEGLASPDCGTCHETAMQGVLSSAHGRALRERGGGKPASSCKTCHGKIHAVVPALDERSPTSRSKQLALCASCHDDPSKTPERVSRMHPVSTYAKTVHGLKAKSGNKKAALCADCHGSHDIRPAIDGASRVSHNRIAETCGRCHEPESTAYSIGVHGRARSAGAKEAPTCTDCHGEHDVLAVSSPESRVSSAAIVQTCSGCHASERIIGKFGLPANRVSSFNDSYHGLASSRGMTRAANCASCHGWHDILPSQDPASRVHPNNLAKTCGKCHEGAGKTFGSGSVHASLSKTASGKGLAGFFRLFYLLLIPLVIGGMLAHNAIDLFRYALDGPQESLKEDHDILLLTFSERVQHAALVSSFIVLAYTGFALEYPNSWWTTILGSGFDEEARRWIHRAAAVILVVVSLCHIGYLSLTRIGRERFKSMLPAMRDLTDPLQVLLYNLGLSRRHPKLARFSYIEKAEYWALNWGTLIMIATGAILAFNRYSLAHFSLSLIEAARVIHLMEAILACLAIIVWHFYWVIFDPAVYPMNWAWLTGKLKWWKAKGDEKTDEDPREE